MKHEPLLQLKADKTQGETSNGNDEQDVLCTQYNNQETIKTGSDMVDTIDPVGPVLFVGPTEESILCVVDSNMYGGPIDEIYNLESDIMCSTLEFDDVCLELDQVSGKTTENPNLSGPDYINDKT